MNKLEAKTLFTKYINNQCSAEELELLDTFLDSYQDDKVELEHTEIKSQHISEVKIWKQIMSKINVESTKKKRFPFKSSIVYAVAASLVLFLAITMFFKDNDTEKKTSTIVEQPIEAGIDKATLTLGDGTAIALEKGEDYTTKNAKSNGETLIYHESDEAYSETIVYNYLTIPRGGQFFVELTDGTKVWLNSASKLKYPVTFKEGEPRNVELVYGEAYFDVSPSTDHQGATFNVTSKSQTIEVLGTEFNIKAYEDETVAYSTLVEGKIGLTVNNQTSILKPSQQAIFSSEIQKLDIITVDVYNETSWREGVFSFKGKTLNELMKVLSRWYDIDVVFEDKALESMTFKGVLGKDQPLKDIMESIKSASAINSYDIKEKTIYIK